MNSCGVYVGGDGVGIYRLTDILVMVIVRIKHELARERPSAVLGMKPDHSQQENDA